MGILNLLKEFAPASKASHLSDFKGRTIAVDAMCWLHRSAFCCALELGLEAEAIAAGRTPPAHPHRYLQWLRRMTRMLVHFGITPIFVFDGGALPAKAGVNNARDSSRAEWRKRAASFYSQGRMEEATDAYGKCVSVTPAMLRNFQHLLHSEGVRVIIAPFEADAQIGFLFQRGDIYAAITEDSDLLPFGCRRILIKLDRDGNCKSIDLDAVVAESWNAKHHPQLNKLKRIMQGPISASDAAAASAVSAVAAAESTRATAPPARSHVNFIHACVLSGCDYLPSLRGIGLRTAIALVDDYPRLDDMLHCLRRDRRKLEEKWRKANEAKKHAAAAEASEAADAGTAAAEDSSELSDNTTTADYISLFHRAVLTFQHQLVFDPGTGEFVNLNPLPPQLVRVVRRNAAAAKQEAKQEEGEAMVIDEDADADGPNPTAASAAASSCASPSLPEAGDLPPSHPLLQLSDLSFLGPPPPEHLVAPFVRGEVDPKTLRPYDLAWRPTDLREIEARPSKGGQQHQQQRAQSYAGGRRPFAAAASGPATPSSGRTISSLFARAASTPARTVPWKQPAPAPKSNLFANTAAAAAKRAAHQKDLMSLFGADAEEEKHATIEEEAAPETQQLDDFDDELLFDDPPPLEEPAGSSLDDSGYGEDDVAPPAAPAAASSSANPFALRGPHQQLNHDIATFANSAALLTAAAASASTPSKPASATSFLASMFAASSASAAATVTPQKPRSSKDFSEGISALLRSPSTPAPASSSSATATRPRAVAAPSSADVLDLTSDAEEEVERKESLDPHRAPLIELKNGAAGLRTPSASLKRKATSSASAHSSSKKKSAKKGAMEAAGKSQSMLGFLTPKVEQKRG